MGRGRPSFTPDFSCPALLKHNPELSACVRYPAITVYGNAFQAFSRATHSHSCRTAARPGLASNPERARPAGLTRARFGRTPVRSPLLRGCCLFLGVHEMFQFPRFPPHQNDAVTTQGGGVAPFGDRRINACTRLPPAYRSYATSFIGTQRRGIHQLLILSSLGKPSALNGGAFSRPPNGSQIGKVPAKRQTLNAER